MDVKFWHGGLQPYEISAIKRLEQVFEPTTNKLKNNTSNQSNIFPWKGYAGFRFSGENRDGEFDLIIITHKIIVIVELKHWHGKITQYDGTWYQNGEDRGRSAVVNTQEKVYLLMKKLEKVKDIFPNKKVPFIQFKVVFTAQCDFIELPDNEKNHVIHIDDFIKITDSDMFNKVFSQEPWRKAGLNSCIPAFDKFMDKGNIKPKELIVDGYIARDEIFRHPTEVYYEYEAESRHNKNDKALLRNWDFSKLEKIDNNLLNPESRYKIISREKDILIHLKSLNETLSDNCLDAMSNPDPKSIMQQYAQLFVLPIGYSRLNEFINRYLVDYKLEDRVKFVKILFKQFADLHNLQVAHRDIGDHSIWFSPQSKIRLSNFIAAYYQPKGTVGNLRDDLSISAIQLPEDLNRKLQSTPFKRDVFSLGIVAWHILNGQSLPFLLILEYIKNIKSKMVEHHNWYDEILEKCLSDNPQDRFSTASQLLDRLNDTAPKSEINFEFDQARLNIYRSGKIVDRVYQCEKELLTADNKEIYVSTENLCVKTWVIDNLSDLNQSYKLYNFFEKIQLLKDLDYSFIPKIEDFGLDKRNTPFLVQRFIEAETWDKINHLAFEDAVKLSICLFQIVQDLHEQNIFHGDLHPENILVMKADRIEDYKIYLLDIVDIDSSGTERFNHKYSPVFDNPTLNQRDNYATLRLSFDLLSYDIHDVSSIRNDIIRQTFNVENLGENKYISLDRVQDSYKRILSPEPSIKVINIGFPDFFNYADYKILPDNGKIYIHIREEKEIYIDFYGIGGSFSCIYDKTTRKLSKTQNLRQRESIHSHIIRDAELYLNDISFSVSKQKYSNLDELNLYLIENKEFLNVVHQFINSLKEDDFIEEIDEPSVYSVDDIESSVSEEIDIVVKNAEADLEQNSFYKKYSVSKIWKSILETELEALPTLELSDDKIIKDGNLHKLKYISETALLENFGNDDEVRFGTIIGDRFSSLGKVNLQRSTTEILVLENFKESNKSRIKLDQDYILQSKKNKSSFIRRKSAMDRILVKQSVISNLVDYFDGGCSLKPSCYDIHVTEEDFKVYEKKSNGKIYGLNDAQKAAFCKLLNYGPIGFLQGPGTGKTEFIGAFTHFLISKLGVKNILLTSQSHEAVNTASERIRELCCNNNIDLDMVRFSNREQVVSDSLLDVYSGTLLTKQYQTFEAEYKNRITQLSASLGVSKEFLKDLVHLDQTLALFVKKLARVNKDLQEQDNNDLRKELVKQKEDLIIYIIDECKKYHLEFNINLSDNIIQQAQYYLANKHGVNPNQLKKSVSIIDISNANYG